MKDDEDRGVLVGEICGNPNGLLRTILVLKESSSFYGEAEINQVLEEVPQDMEPLSEDTGISVTTHTRKEARESCSHLGRALRMEESIVTIVALCGQLVTVKSVSY